MNLTTWKWEGKERNDQTSIGRESKRKVQAPTLEEYSGDWKQETKQDYENTKTREGNLYDIDSLSTFFSFSFFLYSYIFSFAVEAYRQL